MRHHQIDLRLADSLRCEKLADVVDLDHKALSLIDQLLNFIQVDNLELLEAFDFNLGKWLAMLAKEHG